MTAARRTGTIVDIRSEGPSIKTYTIAFDEPFTHAPGQCVTVFIGEKRAVYSIASPPAENTIQFTVRGHKNGYMSPTLFTKNTGDTLDIFGPFGSFTLKDADAYCFIAGGVGVAPFRSMIQHIARTTQAHLTLIHSAKTPDALTFNDEFQKLREKGKLTLYTTVTQDPTYTGNTGRINNNTLQKHVTDDALCYVCGPEAFITHTKELLLTHGVQRERIITESWGRKTIG